MTTLTLADRYARQTVGALLAASTRDGGTAWVSIVREHMISFALDLALPDAPENLSAGKTEPNQNQNERTSMKNPHAVFLGRLGGRAKSRRKTAASRANGRRGGRPREKKREKKRLEAEIAQNPNENGSKKVENNPCNPKRWG